VEPACALSMTELIPRVCTYLPKVQAYLIQQGSTLSEAAQRLVREPDNDAIREELCSPHVAVARG
jgi:hypothetical protein